MDLYEELKQLRRGVDGLQALATDVANHALRQQFLDCAANLSTWVEALAEKCDLEDEDEDDDSDPYDSDVDDSLFEGNGDDD